MENTPENGLVTSVFENNDNEGRVPIKFSEKEHAVITLPLLVSCPLSILGSCCIIYMAKHRSLRGRPYHWIMIFLSMSDIMFSTSIMLQPFLSPSDYVSFAYGTAQTCSIIGAVYLLSASLSALESCILTTYFALTVRFKWSPLDILKYYIQPSQCIALLLAAGPVVASLMTSSINPLETTLMCAIESYPLYCAESGDIECIRGENANIILSARILMTLIVALTGASATLLVYLTVREGLKEAAAEEAAEASNREEDVQKKATAAATKALKTRMNNVKIQALLYTLISVNQLFWPFVSYQLRALLPTGSFEGVFQENFLFMFLIVSNAVYPLQGFLNFFVYVRPSVQEWRRFYKTDPLTYDPVVPSWLTIVIRHVLTSHDIREHVRLRTAASVRSEISHFDNPQTRRV